MGWWQRFLGRRRAAGWSVAWCDGNWLVRPVAQGPTRVSGILRAVRVRTWAGCQRVPGESGRWPEILALELDRPRRVLAPLAWAPASREERSSMLGQVQAWWPGRREPVPDDGVRLLSRQDLGDLPAALGERLEAPGFFYPMFRAGTVVAVPVWGICLLREGDV